MSGSDAGAPHPPSSRSPLAFDAESMRRAGYAAIDVIVDHLSRLGEGPVHGGGSRRDMEALFREPLPREGQPMEDLIARFRDQVIPNSLKVHHPRFFAFIPGSPVYPAVLGDLLAAGANTYVGTWLGSSAGTMIELVVLDWFAEMLGLPQGMEGLLVSGGSVANLTALAVARGERLAGRDEEGVVYASNQRHTCIDRAVRVLGLQASQLRLIASDETYRIRLDALRAAIEEDRSAGRAPFCIVGHGGTTNTGAIDPLDALADLAEAEGLWFHVDAAYGGFAAATERGRALLRGLDRADSIALDPHKWLFQTFEAGCTLVRPRGALAHTFSQRGAYMREVPTGEEEVTLGDRGIQLSRSFRALKIWMTLKTYGAAPIVAAIDRALDLTMLAARRLEEAGFTVVLPPPLSIVAFRIPGADDRAHHRLTDAINRSGEAFLSSTTLDGRAVLRLCVLSPETTEHDIERTVDHLRAAAFGSPRGGA